MEDLLCLVTFQYPLCHTGQFGVAGWLGLPRRQLLDEVRTWVVLAAFSPGMSNPGWVRVCGTLANVAHYSLASPSCGGQGEEAHFEMKQLSLT